MSLYSFALTSDAMLRSSIEEEDAIVHSLWAFRVWERGRFAQEVMRTLYRVAQVHAARSPSEGLRIHTGVNFNFKGTIFVDDVPQALMKWGGPLYSAHLEERLRCEVTAMKYLSRYTDIPVPRVLYWGTGDIGPVGAGPLLITEFVEKDYNLLTFLKDPHRDPSLPIRLNPDITNEELKDVYRQVCRILLTLHQHKFATIGGLGNPLGVTKPEVFDVVTRPIVSNWSSLVNGLSTVPSNPNFSNQRVHTAQSYYIQRAQMLFKDLSSRKSLAAIKSEAEYRKKAVARTLFLKLARAGVLQHYLHNDGPFSLFGNSLSPERIMMKNGRIVSISDWEFTQAAPTEFSFTAPWWLLLTAPEDWEGGIQNWSQHFEAKLTLFFHALLDVENDLLQRNCLTESRRICPAMCGNWTTGHFWITYVLTVSISSFDKVYWAVLDENFYGANKSGRWEKRMELLTPSDIERIEHGVRDFKRRKGISTNAQDEVRSGEASSSAVPMAFDDLISDSCREEAIVEPKEAKIYIKHEKSPAVLSSFHSQY